MIIRVNLHPARKPKTKENPGTKYVAIGLLLAIVTGIVFFKLCSDLEAKTKATKQARVETQQQIDDIKAKISDVATIQSKITELSNRRLVLARLTSTRQGPQFVLNELARLLSNPHDSFARKEATEKGWTLAWEPDNVMIKSFKDIGNGEIQLEGFARTMEDVHEFWNRLKTSPVIRNIRLIEIKDGKNRVNNESNQTFVFQANANFHYQTKEGLSLVDQLIKSNNEDTDEAETPNDQVKE